MPWGDGFGKGDWAGWRGAPYSKLPRALNIRERASRGEGDRVRCHHGSSSGMVRELRAFPRRVLRQQSINESLRYIKIGGL